MPDFWAVRADHLIQVKRLAQSPARRKHSVMLSFVGMCGERHVIRQFYPWSDTPEGTDIAL